MIALVGCGAKKGTTWKPVREMYTSTLFRMSMEIAEQRCDRVYVVSAKHGMLHPNETIAPYEMHIGELTFREREMWASRIVDRLRYLHRHDYQVELYMGREYAMPLSRALRDRTYHVDDPLRGLQIGERLHQLAAMRRVVHAAR